MIYINVNDIERLIEDGKIKHIYLDFDETCTNSIDSVLIQLNRRYGTNYNMYDVNTWNFNNIFPNLKSIEIEEIFDSGEFFDRLTWKSGVGKFIEKHLDIITIVTKGNAMNLLLKELWIKHKFPTIDFIGLEGTVMDKSMVDMGLGTVHIDDNQSNLYSTDSEYKIMFENIPNAEWNNDWLETDAEGEFRVLGDLFHGKVYYEKRFTMKGWE